MGGRVAFRDVISDDINPAAQDIAWIYTGSENGNVLRVHALDPWDTIPVWREAFCTPSFRQAALAAATTSMLNQAAADAGPANGSDPQVDLYASADFQSILNAAVGGWNYLASELEAAFESAPRAAETTTSGAIRPISSSTTYWRSPQAP